MADWNIAFAKPMAGMMAGCAFVCAVAMLAAFGTSITWSISGPLFLAGVTASGATAGVLTAPFFGRQGMLGGVVAFVGAVLATFVAAALAGLVLLPLRQFDLVFADPPYALMDEPRTAKKMEMLIVGLFTSGIIADEGILVFRQRKGSGILPAGGDDFDTDTRVYGTTQVTFVGRSGHPDS